MASRRTTEIRRKGLALAMVASLLAVASPVSALCPNNGWRCGYSGVGVTHQDITEQALESLAREYFGTSGQTKSMKLAVEDVWKANSQIDFAHEAESGRHFDGENFGRGRQFLMDLKYGVVSRLREEDGKTARILLGRALHTLQDFYSHSNFIESGRRGALPALWQLSGTMPAIAGPDEPACKPCRLVGVEDGNATWDCRDNIATDKLTSGYFGGQDRDNPMPGGPTFEEGKCRHGGALDNGPGLVGGINKDVKLALFAPHHFLHEAAADSARQATEAYIRDIAAELTPRQLKLLFGVGPTIAIAVDTTGSMGNVISQVRVQAARIVDERVGTDQEPLRYILMPFNDPYTGPLTVTSDPNEFKMAINALRSSGGGDCPELSMSGALAALAAADAGVDLFTFTDADALDAHLEGAVSSLAAAKDAKLFKIVNGACNWRYSTLANSNDANLAPQHVDPAAWVPNVDPVYRRLAADSGGQVFLLNTWEVGRVAELVDAAARANAVDVLSVADRLTDGEQSYAFDIDSTLGRTTFSLSGLTALTLFRPDGSVVLSEDPGVRVIELSSARIVTVESPMPGAWRASVAGSGDYAFNVIGDSDVDLDRFDFVEEGGRPGHGGLFDIPGFPLRGELVQVAAKISGSIVEAVFELRDNAGSLIDVLALEKEEAGSPNEWYGVLALPANSFVVYARGTLDNGERFQRVLPTRIQPQPLAIIPPPAESLSPGGTYNYRFTVHNVGEAGRFKFSAADNHGFVRRVSPAEFELGADTQREVDVELRVPSDVDSESGNVLTATVASANDPRMRNYAVVESLLVTESVDCSEALPSQAKVWPANHSFAAIEILGVTTSSGAQPLLRVEAIRQDEDPQGEGSGATCPDARGVGSAIAELSVERSGRGDGRVYTIEFSATAPSGARCAGEVQVCVPHSRGGSCTLSPTSYDSTQCRP